MNLIIILIFIIGYILIAAEHFNKINKAAIALFTGVLCWTVYIHYAIDKEVVSEELIKNLGEISGVLFFLLGAMTIVELVDAHDGFDIITNRIIETDKRKLLWIIGFITFFLSALLDNLTTTIVVISLLRKLIRDSKDRLFFTGIVIIAANAGGAWSPIGDITTTMLWIGGQITVVNIITKLILPSLLCILIPLIILSLRLNGKIERPQKEVKISSNALPYTQKAVVFFSSVLILILVPVFKSVTHLPPFMGMLIGLALLWIMTEIIHGKKDEENKHNLSIVFALRKIDTPSILFFLGILLSVDALQTIGALTDLSSWMTENIHNENIIVISIGMISSIFDNVPLVAATQGMYSLSQYPADHYFWEFLAYCAGTGGSVLIIGSAAGIAAMGVEKINFFWYLKNISLLALIGYLSGAFMYILQHQIFGL
ncbi:MAG: sodium:proton antiporter NhaD [Saprospiraceae bacterium]|jgi:Na+/H+ antiporter NhaD/arsenite permease-like protein|nr:sodium:proton antiporter NhaD [Saprospiraceae bacterium]MBL0027136.1 sodium:proton antiporter NhaD [Saprospiraceae bacterium]